MLVYEQNSSFSRLLAAGVLRLKPDRVGVRVSVSVRVLVSIRVSVSVRVSVSSSSVSANRMSCMVKNLKGALIAG